MCYSSGKHTKKHSEYYLHVCVKKNFLPICLELLCIREIRIDEFSEYFKHSRNYCLQKNQHYELKLLWQIFGIVKL